MKRYEVYRSEGGFRVARECWLGCPVVKSSPWFPNRGLAVAWRNREAENDWNYQCELASAG